MILRLAIRAAICYNIVSISNKKSVHDGRKQMKKIKLIVTIVATVLLLVAGFMAARFLNRDAEAVVSATSIEERLSKCSSLSTARLDYRGIVKYTDGDIQFINKKGFSMIYDAHIKAGIDLSKAQVTIKGKKIRITVPAPEIQDVTVDSGSLEFYDEQLALFNWTDKSDTVKAIEFAKQDAKEKASQTDILSQASEQARTVIETLLLPVTSEDSNTYEMEFVEE